MDRYKDRYINVPSKKIDRQTDKQVNMQRLRLKTKYP